MSADDVILSRLEVHRVPSIGDCRQISNICPLNRLGSDQIKNVTTSKHDLHAKLTCRSQSIDLLRVLEGGGRAFLIRTETSTL
jgi:hypothetical protein